MMGIRFCGLLYVASYAYLVVFAVAQITDPSEVSALVAVKIRLIDPMDNLINWNEEDPCLSSWTGVFCFDTISETDRYLHVQELRLLNMNLSGSLAPEIGLLSHLLILDFMWNDLKGSIPKEIGNISSLTHLLLNGNRLSGSLPEELGKLSNLDRLQVDANSISGPIPKSFANLSRVKHLHLNNSIVGQLPPELSKLSELLHLLVDNNNLTGYLPPEYSEMPNLHILQLDNNFFAGAEIPATYGNFSILSKLSLRNCGLQGAVPDLSRIARFYYLDLSRNQLTGHIPSDKLSDFVRTIDLSENNLTGSVPTSFAELPFLQRLSLENNFLNGSIPASIWQNKSMNSTDRLSLDLRNNSFSSILGDLNPPNNVTVRLGGNPICTNAKIPNIGQFCDFQTEDDGAPTTLTNSKCPTHECPLDGFYGYEPASGDLCACAAPLWIGYRLKSPSFSYFPPYANFFSACVTNSLSLSLYQLSIDSFVWEKGPRLRMYLKLFPPANTTMFNSSEVHRIGHIFTSWAFSGKDLFGPYELLNFTLLGPYAGMIPVTRRTSSISKGILAAIVVGAIACAVAITAILKFLVTRRHARNKQSMSRSRLSRNVSMKIDGVKAFKFKDLASATDNFNSSTQVGKGGYGKVYRGVLSDNAIVAIKRAEKGSLQGQKEFLTEINLLSRLHHRNLVALLGYCDEEEEQMLVYEYMPNGTLRHWLSGKDKACSNFSMRVRIALDSAKGILYLHTEANPPVFHRDIKASNILLDSKLIAKVSDFGLSRLAPVMDDQGTMPTHVSTAVKGTPGYLDPEYFLTYKLTDKSDVYSLGVVLLELLTGMEPISNGKNIVREVNAACESGLLLSIIDNRMEPCPAECLERFVALALNCCHDKTERRPSMLDVARELENILKMMPETDATLSEATSIHSTGKSALESDSFSFTTRDQYFSSNVSGSKLVSAVTPTISPL